MKRGLILVLGIGLLLLGWSSFRRVQASGIRCGVGATQVNVVGRIGEGRPFVALHDIGETPYLDPDTGETIVPLRPLFSILSGPTKIDWQESNRTATFLHGEHLLTVYLGESGEIQARMDGQPYPLRVFLCDDGRLHAPLRQVTDAIGLEVRWYHSDRTAVIDPVWTTGVHSPVSEPTTASRPAACRNSAPARLSDLLTNPLEAWDRAVRQTACSLLI